MNLQNLLDHLNEVKNTLANGQVGQRAKNYSANFSQNLQKTLPMLKPNPTIQDMLDGGINIGGIGAIRRPQDVVMPYAREYVFEKAIKPNVVSIGNNFKGSVANIKASKPDIAPREESLQDVLDRFTKKLDEPAHGIVLPTYQDNLHSAIKNYTANSWATDGDELVYAIDNGLDSISLPINRSIDLPQLVSELNSRGANINLKIPKNYSPYFTSGSKTEARNLKLEDELADIVRDKFGTNKIAKTANGTRFENNNDLFALQNALIPDWRHRFSLDNYNKYRQPGEIDKLSITSPHLAKMYEEFINEADKLDLSPGKVSALPGNFKDMKLIFDAPFSMSNFKNSFTKGIDGTPGNTLADILLNYQQRSK